MSRTALENKYKEELYNLKVQALDIQCKKNQIKRKVDLAYDILMEPIIQRKSNIIDILNKRIDVLNACSTFNTEDIISVLDTFMNNIDETSFYTNMDLNIITSNGKRKVVNSLRAIVDVRIIDYLRNNGNKITAEEYKEYSNNGYIVAFKNEPETSFYKFDLFCTDTVVKENFDFAWFEQMKIFVVFIMEYRKRHNIDITKEKMLELEEVFIRELKDIYKNNVPKIKLGVSYDK